MFILTRDNGVLLNIDCIDCINKVDDSTNNEYCIYLQWACHEEGMYLNEVYDNREDRDRDFDDLKWAIANGDSLFEFSKE